MLWTTEKKIFCMEKINILVWKYRLGFGALNVMVQYRFGRTNWGSVVHEFWFNYLGFVGFVARSQFFRLLIPMRCNAILWCFTKWSMYNLVLTELESYTVKTELDLMTWVSPEYRYTFWSQLTLQLLETSISHAQEHFLKLQVGRYGSFVGLSNQKRYFWRPEGYEHE